jgi:DNA-binding NarL/FixJ family response regulator
MSDTIHQEADRHHRLLVVDDHEIVRQGLVAMLTRRPGFQVVAEAGTAAEAIEMAHKFQPDLVVMDVRLPDGSGIEACREIRAEMPGTKVVILTSYPDEEAVFSAIVAGASGYLLKQVRGRDLVAALEAVGRGESLLDPAVTEKVLDRVRRIASGGANDDLAQLTSQEQKILLLVERPTRRLLPKCSCPTRRSRTTSARSSRSSTCSVARRPRRTSPNDTGTAPEGPWSRTSPADAADAQLGWHSSRHRGQEVGHKWDGDIDHAAIGRAQVNRIGC